MTEEPKTHRSKPTGRVFDANHNEVSPDSYYWLGKYSDMPHILSFLNLDYQTIFEVLETDPEVAPLLGPFQTLYLTSGHQRVLLDIPQGWR